MSAAMLTPTPMSSSRPTPRQPDLRIDFKKVKSEGISHHFPVFVDLCIPGKEGDNPSVQALVEEVRAQGQKVSTFPVEWRGKTAEELKEALSPMVLHYRVQALLLCERTRRRVIENEETTTWSNIHVAFQYTTPLKHKLMAHWAKNMLERQLAEVDQLHESGDASTLQSSRVPSESSFRYRESPMTNSLLSPPVGGGSVPDVPTQPHSHTRPSHTAHRQAAAPPMLPSRGRVQGGSARQSSTPVNPGTGPDPTAAATKPPRPSRRLLSAAEAQDSAVDFEKTLTMLLESTQHVGNFRGTQRPPPPQHPPSKPLTPLNLPLYGGSNSGSRGATSTVKDAFESAIKDPVPPTAEAQ